MRHEPRYDDYGRTERGGLGIVLLLGTTVLCAAAYYTYGEHWREVRNEEGVIAPPYIEILDESDQLASAAATPLVPSDANSGVIEQQLLTRAPWCSTVEMKIDNSTTVNICLDEETLNIGDHRVYGAMRTEPRIEQTEGNPSLYLTFEHDVAVPICIEAKQEIKQQLNEDLENILGAEFPSYSMDIHVDKRNPTHPCDDPLPEE